MRAPLRSGVMSLSSVAPPADEPQAAAPIRWTRRVEDALINLVLLVMIALPIGEILVRKTLGQSITSASIVVQHLTLWAAFLGALLCTREGRHLSLSTAELLPEGKPREIARVFTHSIAAAVTGLFSYASYNLVVAEMASSSKIVGDVPEWVGLVIMPVALALMAIRLILRASPRWGGRAIAFAVTAAAFALGAVEFDADPLRWPLALVVFVALLLGAPIYVAMCGLATLLFFTDGTPIASVTAETLRLVSSPSLPAIPLLTVAGYILGEGGAARRLVALCRAWFGWMPGGLAIMVCLVCAIFTAFTGGSGVTILALGGLVFPILVGEKYPEGFSLGLVTASGSLGLLFPPSLPVILYSVVAQIYDLNSLYIAGLVPGALMILMVCAYGVVVGIKSDTHRTPFVLPDALRATWAAKWEIGLPLLVGAAILFGWATIVEAAALACAYAITTEVVVHKDITPRGLPKTVVHGATLVGSVLVVLGVALGLTSYLVDADIPALVITWVKAHIDSQFGFLLVLNLILLVLGSVFEIFSAIVILAPLVAPLGEAYGVHPIHLAIVFLANLELGFLLPPVGLNLFLSSSRFNRPLPVLYRHALPFLCIMALGVLLITYVPAMTLGVLELLGGGATAQM
jgi:C4-dicarboxylate transporter, DctM subunit